MEDAGHRIIRVLQVRNSLGRGGVESFVTDPYENMDRNKIQFVFCIVEGRSEEHLEEVVDFGARV